MACVYIQVSNSRHRCQKLQHGLLEGWQQHDIDTRHPRQFNLACGLQLDFCSVDVIHDNRAILFDKVLVWQGVFTIPSTYLYCSNTLFE